MATLLQRTCLRPNYSLRRQLLLSYGSAAFLSLGIVVVLACVSAWRARGAVQDNSRLVMVDRLKENMLSSSRYASERISQYMENLGGTVQIISEVVRDRIVGYPNDGWQDDRYVPFYNNDSQSNVYPLQSPPLRFDWNLDLNVNISNAREHLQERGSFIKLYPSASTAGANFFFQGVCDPSATDPTSPFFFENCTEANNNVTTGGVVEPTSVMGGLYEKAADFGVAFKPLFEAQEEALLVAFYFINDGAGASTSFPGTERNGSALPYLSQGCDYLKETNPYTGRPLGTAAQIARCHPAGAEVIPRLFNPIERVWFADIVLNPTEVRWYGPIKAGDHGFFLFTISRAVFDRRTHELIGAATVIVSLEDMTTLLLESRLYNESQLSVVRPTGEVVADTLYSLNTGNGTVYVWDTGVTDEDHFIKLRDGFNFHRNLTWSDSVATYNNGLLSIYPLPVPPEEYDPNYKPQYYIVQSIGEIVYEKIDKLNKNIDNHVEKIITKSVGIGLCGIFMVLCIVALVSWALTQPLLWMESIAWRIVNHNDERVGQTMDFENETEATGGLVKCAPRTEINDLVSEFRKLIQGFSGEGASQTADPILHEVLNEITWQSDFKLLYSRVAAKRHSFRMTSITTHTTDDEEVEGSRCSEDVGSAQNSESGNSRAPLSTLSLRQKQIEPSSPGGIVPAPLKQNSGPNLIRFERESQASDFAAKENVRAYRSALFWWIFVLIIIPLLLAIALVCTIASESLVGGVHNWVNETRNTSSHLEVNALQSITFSKARLATTQLFPPVRDLYLLSRVANWLYFGGVQRSDGFTAVDEATELCKGYPPAPDMSCPYFTTDRPVCDCTWGDPQDPGICVNHSSDPRYLQRRMFASNNIDTDPTTGDYFSASSFPSFWNTPNDTSWWNNASVVPGADKGANASGFVTTYDRIRVASALAVVEFPIYNYEHELEPGAKMYLLGTGTATEADGTWQGYPGCDASLAYLAHWESTTENRASVLNKSLCPLGKYGFDPRCRPWFVTGKAKYEDSSNPLYITPPYLFANKQSVAVSATAPVVNPASGEYVGQTVVDFWPAATRTTVRESQEPVSFIITPEKDVFGGNTVVGPNRSADWRSAPLGDLLFNYDSNTSAYRMYFDKNVLPLMNNGTTGLARFMRTLADGQTETLLLAFSPILLRTLLPIDPTDFSRGVNLSSTHVYTLGIASVVETIAAPFDAIEDEVLNAFDLQKDIYTTLAVVVSAFFIFLTFKITINVAVPVMTLLRLVQSINEGKIEGDIPPLEGGSTEVRQVYNSFGKLTKIVRISNIAFFSGNFQWAYHFTNDALALFRKVKDRKAIGIACNNLGSTCYAWLCAPSRCGELGGMTDEDGTLKAGLERFDEAIQIGRMEFEEAAHEELKADCAQQLADRLFNRGMFFVLIHDRAAAPADSFDRGVEDFSMARELDYDVKDFWLERKLLLRHSGTHFNRLLRRIHGLANILPSEEIESVWDIKELIDDADRLLFAAWNEPNAPLFDDISRVGRLQQLEAAVIRAEINSNNYKEAGRLAMRMLCEDEYLIESSFWSAANALLRVIADDDACPFSTNTAASVRSDLRKMLGSCRSVSINIGKCLVFAFEVTERWEGDSLWERINSKCLRLYDSCCSKDDHIGIVAFTLSGDLTLNMEEKEQNEHQQRSTLDIATTSTSEKAYPAFPHAVQMLVDAEASMQNDSYVILFVDGFSWDSEAYKSIKWQIERLNRERKTSIHVIILGLDVEVNEVVNECRMMCTITKTSFYADVTMKNVDSIFEQLEEILSGPLSVGALQGISMQKF